MVPLKITFTRLMLGAVAALVIGSAKAHDPDHMDHLEWYQSLMQPDAPTSSCCGEADAYWADEIHVRNGKTYAKITGDRSDEPRHPPHIDVGTEIEIPNNKLKGQIESNGARRRVLEPRGIRLLLRPAWRRLKFGPVAVRGLEHIRPARDGSREPLSDGGRAVIFR
jgi:hypothetical protein